MNITFDFSYLFFLFIAILLDVIANIFVKLSNGFKHKHFVFAAIFSVLAAFTALSFAIEGIPLAVAYGVWGGLGLIATTIVSILMFGERLNKFAWAGIFFVMSGVLLMKFSHLF